jgi:hypothetical protein
MGLLDELRKSQYLQMADEKLQGLLNIPTEAQRFLTNPQAFMGLLGKNELPRETGFAAGATGLPPKNVAPGGLLNPPNLAYQTGYEQGEPFSYAAMAAPMAVPAAKALAPKAGQMTENYLRSIGGIADIVPVDTARSIRMPTTLPTDDIFKKAVQNTPGATVTDEGLVMSLMRKQKPQQAETESVRGGVFYLPEGSSNMKHYGGTNYYGGTENIAGETLYKNPLVVKGATGGKAPEEAYIKLTSKDNLKEMQDDVFKAVNSGSPNMRSDLIEQFLAKHAPDLEGYSDYIISNSKQGNQLRYALQEAAIAQKTRDAGYDAVIGYSKKKTGDPFLSEVFDVREAIYPSKHGDYRLMDKFEGLLD